MKIWIVEGSGRDYEDAREWQVKAFFRKSRAEKLADQLRTGKVKDTVHAEHYSCVPAERYYVYSLDVGDPAERYYVVNSSASVRKKT